MLKEYIKREEKKVEYIELIYDLMFVFIIRRSIEAFHHIEGDFFTLPTYTAFIVTMLTVLQVWYFTTLFLNRYGSNGVAEYIGLFINMYLLYYMARGAVADPGEYYAQFNTAWGLILINISVQYALKLRKPIAQDPVIKKHIIFNICLLAAEAALIFGCIPLYNATGLMLSPFIMLLGAFAVLTFGKNTIASVPVDFPHMSERLMLYIVFTFGEMVIGIAGYFDGGVTPSGVYYSLTAFMAVAGLFLVYGYYYDHIIDRERKTHGSAYIIAHIFMITMLNNITIALELMPNAAIDDVKKNIFLVSSLVLFFASLSLTLIFAKSYHKPTEKFFVLSGGLTVIYIILMGAFYRNSYVNIAVTVVYIYSMLLLNILLGYKASENNKIQKLLH